MKLCCTYSKFVATFFLHKPMKFSFKYTIYDSITIGTILSVIYYFYYVNKI